MTREAIILAGGLGSRLRSVLSDRPKPMADINGRPFMEYLADHLILQGIDRIILAAGYMAGIIQSHFGNRYGKAEIVYAIEEKPLGTGGGLKNALPLVKGDRVFVVNGDTYFGIPFREMEELFVKKQADVLIALCHADDQTRYGSVWTDPEGRVLKFTEKKDRKGPSLVNGGVYLMKKGIFNGLDLPEIFSFEKDFLEKNAAGTRIFGKLFPAEFIDIGIPETLRYAGFFFRQKNNDE
jgi:D-glycero-alpha-D-manno-heptose 1-phosphate guanylyltransferase